jgi:hypothetical protein
MAFAPQRFPKIHKHKTYLHFWKVGYLQNFKSQTEQHEVFYYLFYCF